MKGSSSNDNGRAGGRMIEWGERGKEEDRSQEVSWGGYSPVPTSISFFGKEPTLRGLL